MIALDDATVLSVEEVTGQETPRGDALEVFKTGVRCYSDGDNKFDADA
jgi:hypothetical protein